MSIEHRDNSGRTTSDMLEAIAESMRNPGCPIFYYDHKQMATKSHYEGIFIKNIIKIINMLRLDIEVKLDSDKNSGNRKWKLTLVNKYRG